MGGVFAKNTSLETKFPSPFGSGNFSSLDWYFSQIPLPNMIYLYIFIQQNVVFTILFYIYIRIILIFLGKWKNPGSRFTWSVRGWLYSSSRNSYNNWSNSQQCRFIYLQICVSLTNKTDHHDITEIVLKVALNTINPQRCV